MLWGPLARYYHDVATSSQEDFVARVGAAEEQVAACMAALGFEYFPAPGSYVQVSADDLVDGPLEGSEEYAQEYGYGAVRTPSMTSSAPEDPNEEIRSGLSPEALAEYETALHGSWGGTGDAPGPDELGCSARARESMAPPETDPFQGEILAELSRIETELVPADSRVTELDARWASCMADAGYPGLLAHRTAREEMWLRYLEHGGGEGSVGEDGLTDSEREFGAIEIPQAIADWACRDELGYDAVVREVRDAFEQQFVDAHGAELDAWRASVHDSGGS